MISKLKPILVCAACILAAATTLSAQGDPLRIFIQGGPKTHGPGEHDHPRFLEEWTELLDQRGAIADGSMEFPSAEQLAETDVLIINRQNGGFISGENRENLENYLQRGGGIVVLHAAVVSDDPHWFKTVIGGAWENGHSKWYEGKVGLYFPTDPHPITKGVSNFDLDDEIYWDLHFAPGVEVLARSFHDPFTIAPQMWVYETDNHRAFVWLQGHVYENFDLPHIRALLLRGIAWAGNRDVDLLTTEEEVASLVYPEGGPTPPEEAEETLVVHPEFDATLIADESLLTNPISMVWDPQGRLWVAETPEYPFKQDRDRPARDRISILTDTDSDGKLDHRETFFEGLELITSIVFYRDGVIVAQAPEMLWIRDTNGDDRADTTEVVFTGFGTGDTHAVINNMRWGMDGWIYMTQGYSGADPVNADGKRFGHLGSGVIRFKPDGSAIEMVSSKGGNTWGVDFTWDGELFFAQANGDHLNHVVIPQSDLARGRVGSTTSFHTTEDHKETFPIHNDGRPTYRQIDHVGGFTSASGSEIYSGGAWPEEFEGNHFVSEPTVFLVHRDVILPNGSTFTAVKPREEVEFIASTDLWFAPIHQRVGPDGALYILDFYNQAVVHNDTRGPEHGPGNAAVRPDRDHKFGRLWHVQHKDAVSFDAPELDHASPEELAQALEHPNRWFRMTAHRLLTEAEAPTGHAALKEILESSDSEAAKVHALWILHQHDALTDKELSAALNSSSDGIKKNALRIAAEKGKASQLSSQIHARVLEAIDESDPHVQLEAFLALSTTEPDSETIQEVVGEYADLGDNWLRSAAFGTLRRAPVDAIVAVLDQDNSEAMRSLAALLAGEIKSAKEAAALVVHLAESDDAPEAVTAEVLESLAQSVPQKQRPKWTSALESAFRALLNSEDAEVPATALPLIARWDTEGALSDDLAQLVNRLGDDLDNASLPDDYRARIATNLLGISSMNEDVIPAVAHILSTPSSADLQTEIIEALGEVPAKQAGVELVNVFPTLAPALQATALDQLMRRPEWTRLLLDAIKAGEIQVGSLGPAGIHRLRQHPDADVAAYATEVIDEVQGAENQAKDEIIAAMLPVVSQPGNRENGRMIFQSCAACHSFEGQGADVAPDLTGMGAHGAHSLLTYIIDPNRVVESNYIAYNVETKSGETYYGIIARQQEDSIVLKNAGGGEIEIQRENIASMRSTGKSLMPEGYEAFGAESLRDLITYLGGNLSKYQVLNLGTAYTADSTHGIYSNPDHQSELPFANFGVVQVAGIPFQIDHPSATPTGNNLIVLRGHNDYSRNYPREVSVPVEIAAPKLHVLGGIGAWGYPYGDEEDHNVPVLKATLHYADGETEEIVMKNGVEFADWFGQADVPGSIAVEEDLLTRGDAQLRRFTIEPQRPDIVIESITFERVESTAEIAPTIVAITAERSESE